MNSTQRSGSEHRYPRVARTLLVLLAIAPLCGSLFIYCPVWYQDPRLQPFYKRWVQVNPTPHRVPARIAADCAAIPASLDSSVHNDPNGTADKFSVAYVNPVGRDAMFSARPQFPPGSIIVKEKLSDSVSGSIELVAMMIKQQPGYDPDGGDWEYRVAESYTLHPIESGRIQHCRACHAYRRDMDFVYRTYLSPERIE